MLLSQTTQPVGWGDPAIVIPLVTSSLLALLAWWAASRAGKAQTTATKALTTAESSQRSTADLRNDVRSVNEQMTSIAQNQTPPVVLPNRPPTDGTAP